MLFEDAHFSTCMHRVMTLNGFSETRPVISKGKPVILIDDTIHTGETLARVLSDLRSCRVKVSKIFCYLANETAVNSLVKQRLIKREQIYSLYSSDSEEEYLRQSKQLQVFFRSHIEPTDPDVCFNLYNTNVREPKQLAKILKNAMQPFFGETLIEEQSEPGLASTTKELSCLISDYSILQKWADQKLMKKLDYSVNSFDLRFKMNQKEIDSDFTVIPRISATCSPNIEPIGSNRCFKKSEKGCIVCKIQHPKNITNLIKPAYCAACLDCIMCGIALGKLNLSIRTAFAREKQECILKMTYRTWKT